MSSGNGIPISPQVKNLPSPTRQHSVLPPFVALPPCRWNNTGHFPQLLAANEPFEDKKSRANEVCQRSFGARQAKKPRGPSNRVEGYGAFFLISWAHKVKRTMLGKDQGGQQIKLYAESDIFHSLETGSTVGGF